MDERDTEAIVSLTKQPLDMKRPEQDMALAQVYALDLGLCDQAIEAIDELTWALIADQCHHHQDLR